MNKSELKKRLVEQYDYKNSMVDDLLNDIMKFSPEWSKAFFDYLEKGIIPDTVCEGFTVQRLMDESQSSLAIGAFVTMDELMKNPEETLKYIKRGIR